MKVKRNIFIFIITIFSQYYLIKCYFSNSTYIKLFKKVEDFEKFMKIKSLNYGFVLIYNNSNNYCKEFAQIYIKLSEIFHKDLFFYAFEQTSKYQYKSIKDDVPKLFFYEYEKNYEYKLGFNFKTISKFIRNHIPNNCTEITYNNIYTAYNEIYQKDDKNFIIGYFEKNSKYINSFISISNNLKNENFDLCFYCTNYKLIKEDNKNLLLFKDIKENEVRIYNKDKDNNIFIFNESNNEIINNNNYKKFLFNNIKNIYKNKSTNIENINIHKIESLSKKEEMIDNLTNKTNLTNEEHNLDENNLISNISDININNDINNNIDINNNDNNLVTIDNNDIMINNNTNFDNMSKINKINKLNNYINRANVSKKNIMKKNNKYNKKNIFINDRRKYYSNIINISKNKSKYNHARNRMMKLNKNKKIKYNNNFNYQKININNLKENKNNNIKIESEKTKRILYIFLIIICIFVIIYIIITKFLCVGFIKVYDSQIIELNQPNKIEII